MTEMLMGELPPDFATRFSEMVAILDKIEKWWIANVDIATDPKLESGQVDESNIIPGPIMALRALMDVALGSDEDARKHLGEFRRLTSTITQPS